MSDYHLAQLNIARLSEPIDSPRLADFVAALDRINALADEAPGFVWRLQSEDGDATAMRPFGDDYLVNISVWEDIGSLHAYVYRSAHVDIMRRKKEWFEKMRESHLVLWWVPKGHLPTEAEAGARLETLRAEGPCAEAFTFARPFPPPGAEDAPAQEAFAESCPAH